MAVASLIITQSLDNQLPVRIVEPQGDFGTLKPPKVTKPTLGYINHLGAIFDHILIQGTSNLQNGALTNSFSIPTTEYLYTSTGDRYFNFGLITKGEKAIECTIYNNTDSILEVSDIAFLSVAGIVISGLTVGTTIPAYGSVTFSVIASRSVGLAEIVSTIFITYTSGLETLFTFSISRASPPYAYSLLPERSTYSESYIYSTEVVKFTNGREIRNSLMDTPKRRVGYKAIVTTQELIDFGNNIIYLSYNKELQQPIWSSHKQIGTDLRGNSILFDTTDTEFVEGGSVVIFSDPLFPVIETSVSVASTGIVLSNSLDIDAPYFVAPSFSVLPSKKQKHMEHNTRLGEFTFKNEEL